jgi:hypothetical protein
MEDAEGLAALSIDPDIVYTIGYRFDLSAATEPKASVVLYLGVVVGLERDRRCFRHEIPFSFPLEPSRHWHPGASETLGLVHGRLIPEGATEDSTLLERNIADLVTMYVCQAAKRKNSVVLIMGPPLAKIVGRLGYRNLHHSVTIAFFTWGKNAVRVPRFSAIAGSTWSGPTPTLHEDALCRTFYSVKPTGDISTRVRLDLFSQYLARDGEPIDAHDAEPRHTPQKKLAILNSIIKAGYGFRTVEGVIDVPRNLGMLSRSLCWSDEKFKRALKQNRDSLIQTVLPNRVDNLINNGVLEVEPRSTLAHRLKTEDPLFMRETLFSELEQKIEDLGSLAGMTAFIGTNRV